MKKTTLMNRVGDFKYLRGCQSAEEFRSVYQELWDKHGEQGFKEMYWDRADGVTDEDGIKISVYEYGNGGYATCSVALTPLVLDDKEQEELMLTYDIYVETDGHPEMQVSISVGKEEDVVSAFEEVMTKETKKIAEEWEFSKGDLCKHKHRGVAIFVEYEDCEDECIIRLMEDGVPEEHQEEIRVSAHLVKPYFA